MDPLNEIEHETDEASARIGSLVDERYKILEPMASGSMGAVYKAERVPVGKLVAIKFLHSSYAKDAEFLSRFERETRVMSKLSHPNCVSVVDFGVWEGAPYLVMEYVGGDHAARADRPGAARGRSARSGWRARSRPGSRTRTRRASSTATSSRRTS